MNIFALLASGKLMLGCKDLLLSDCHREGSAFSIFQCESLEDLLSTVVFFKEFVTDVRFDVRFVSFIQALRFWCFSVPSPSIPSAFGSYLNV